MNKPEYDISEYTDKELYDVLDLVNPSDRELEAKILMKLREYNNGNGNGKNDGLIDFLNQIYHHFFEESEEEEEDTLIEGFAPGQSEDKNGTPTPTPSATPGSKPGQAIAGQGTAGQGTAGQGTAGQAVSAIQTTTIDYPKGNLNPQPGGGKETRQRTIVINSIERDSNLYPNSSYFSGDLDETLFNVVALKYFSISVPYAWYNVTKEYGANFIYIAGTSPGINNGNFNYKLQIQPGQYVLDSKNTDYDIITAIQIAITKMKQTYSDVNFGTTDISLNYTFTPNDPSFLDPPFLGTK